MRRAEWHPPLLSFIHAKPETRHRPRHLQSFRTHMKASTRHRMQLPASNGMECLACSPRGRGGGTATARAAPTEGKRMDKILTLLILLLQGVKLVLEYLNR